jgi:hypothetical protein
LDFDLSDPNNAVLGLLTDDVCLGIILDTMAYWTQDLSLATTSQLCLTFYQNTKGVEVSIYDLDFNDSTDFKFLESMTVNAYSAGSV